MQKIWAKGYTLHPLVDQYEAARNATLDAAIVKHDIWGSLAHARMLYCVGLLTKAEWNAIHTALVGYLTHADTITPAPGEEDIHTTIERLLSEEIGEAGKKLHTGRSRNDQILVDLRLYAKEQGILLAQAICDGARAFLLLARREEWTPMPGYTHMQRGMLSSIGLWASSYAYSLLDDLIMLDAAWRLHDQSPLGSGAAFGVPLPLDRELVARLLGFASIQPNVLTAANSRGKGEAAIVQACALILLDLSKFAQDLLLFTTSEFAFMTVPRELRDGSSIMPQKYNLGAIELLRARAHTVTAAQQQILGVLAGLPSGYNMDYQETKAPFMQTLAITLDSLQLAALYANQITVDRERLAAACTEEIFATDRAYALVREGVPFRDAYRRVAADPSQAIQRDLLAALHERTSTGAPGNLQLDHLAAQIDQQASIWLARQQAFTTTIEQLITLA